MTKVDPGVLPEGWKSCRFGDCARLVNGRAYSQDELLDHGTPVLRIQNLNGGHRWYYSDLELPEEKYCVTGDLLFAWSASFGPYRFSGPKSIFHYHIWRVLPNETLDKAFAYYLLQWVTESVKLSSHGVAMLHMTKAGMEAWPIRLPPLSVQRRIAEILDRAEALRVKRHAALVQLDALTQSIFLDLFGDPLTSVSKWPRTTLGDVLEHLAYGPRFYNESYSEDGVRIVRITDLDEAGRLDFDGMPRLAVDNGDREKYGLREGDLLFARSGSVGKSAVFPAQAPPCIAGAYFIVMRFKGHITSLFVRSVLATDSVQRFIQSRSRQAIQPNFSGPALRALSLPVPPFTLQREFADRVAAMEKLKSTHCASLANLDRLFAVLQHRAFRGEL